MFARLFWPHGGGVEKHVERLSAELIKRGNEITLITEQYDPKLPLEDNYKGIRIIRIPYFALSSKHSVWTWMDKQSEIIEKSDILHIHDVFWWYWPQRIFLLMKPVYITFHGYEGNDPPTWKAVVYRKASELVSAGSICVGDFMRKWYLARPSKVIYGATDGLLSSSSKAVINKNNKQAVFWGRLDYDTGIDVYADAVKQIPNLSLKVYGEGPVTPVSIKVHPWTNDIGKILKPARYAFVSRYLSIVEAMRSRRLVVATYNNQIKKDYLMCHPMSDNMIIVGTTTDLVTRIKNLTIEQEKRMIEQSYQWAKDQTWQKIANEYEQLWQK